MNEKEYELLIKICADFGLDCFERIVPHAGNNGLPKAWVTSFNDSLVLNQTLVFQMNGSAVTPRLRQAPNRWATA